MADLMTSVTLGFIAQENAIEQQKQLLRGFSARNTLTGEYFCLFIV